MIKNLTKLGAVCLSALFLFGCQNDDEINPDFSANTGKNLMENNCYTIDFESFSATDFPITQVSGDYGTVGIFAKKRAEGVTSDEYTSVNVARVYDARVHTGDDGHDLGVPDQLGNMLIANQYTPEQVAADPDGLDAQGYKYSDPSDNAWGATMELDFSSIEGSVMLKTIQVVDIDKNHVVENSSYVKVIDANNASYTFPLTAYEEEGSVQTVTLNVANAKKLIVVLDGVNASVGSGAIDNIVFCREMIVPNPPLEGCTRTQGYWKNHGPDSKHYDATWGEIEEIDNFYGTGISYMKILNTPPKKGNAYLILAHQFIAAQLNMLSGASISPVSNEFKMTEDFFLHATYGQESWGEYDRDDLTDWAEALDKYNNGEMGVPHCED